MKKINYLFVAASLSCGALISCSDDLDVKTETLPEDSILLQIEVPRLEVVNTRATESTVSDLTVFLFNENGSTLYDRQEFTNVSGQVTVKLSGGSKTGKKMIYAVANAKDKLGATAISSLSDIESLALTDASIELGNGLVMSGTTGALTADATSGTITLTRLVSKMSMKFGSGVSGYSLSGFDVKNVSDGVYVGAGTNSAKMFYATAGKTLNVTAGSTCETYLYPSKATKSASSNPAYVLLKATPEGSDTPYYYRLDLKNTDGEKLDIEPNTEYSIEITGINHAGFADANDAALYTEDGWVSYEIHDHVANVLSMTTDGLRELGITYDFEFDATTGAQNYITVKYYTPVESEYPKDYGYNQDATLTLSENDDWLEIGDPQDDTTESGKGDGDQYNKTKGKSKKYPISLNSSYTFTGTKDATLTVNWMGLKRQVKVTYKHEFTPVKISRSILYISKNKTSNLTYDAYGTASGDDLYIPNYWKFLNMEGTMETEKDDCPKLYGVDSYGMGPDIVRNQGFHFPMPYGDEYDNDNSNFWRYEYVVDFCTSNSPFGTTCKVTKATVRGEINDLVEAVITGSDLGRNTGENGFVVLRMKKNNYNYCTGKLDVTLSYGSNQRTTVSFDLYHTGFFHFDNSGKAYKGKKGYFYYEVVPLEGEGNSVYWLDRNLGATSRGLYIESSSGSVLGDDVANMFMEGAQGGYYTPGTKGESYKPAKINDDICPPGYHIPTKTELDDVRLSSRFHNEQIVNGGKTYYTSYIESQNEEAGDIYFPKARYKKGDATVGISRAGYYWTRTSAAGLEKDQIGQWLRSLCFNASSNSYISGDITTYQMSVRCVAGKTAPDDKAFTIGFNVKGATHVYLYTYDVDSGKRAGLFSFPGKPICDYQSVTQGKTINFSYTSSDQAQDLFVFFTYMDESGAIKIYDNTGADQKDAARGWRVVNGGTYEMNDSGKKVPDGAAADD